MVSDEASAEMTVFAVTIVHPEQQVLATLPKVAQRSHAVLILLIQSYSKKEQSGHR